MRVVAKVGTSSLTDRAGVMDRQIIGDICAQISQLRVAGHEVVLVTSGAISAGVSALGLSQRPQDMRTLQALAAVGQSRLMEVYNDEFARHHLVAAQVLLVPHDFVDRAQYLHARDTLERLLELGCVPVVNENDAITNDEIRFGDNDHISALLSHLLRSDILILLTDTDGLYTSDPHLDKAATLITDVFEGDPLMSVTAGLSGSNRGSGGMASKLSAARIASWSGVRTVIARANVTDVLNKIVANAVADVSSHGTTFHGSDHNLSARQLWVAFASEVCGQISVDAGAAVALSSGTVSLLCAGVINSTGEFESGETVDIIDPHGVVIARGSSLMTSQQVRSTRGLRSSQLEEGLSSVVVHRDALVLIPH